MQSAVGLTPEMEQLAADLPEVLCSSRAPLTVKKYVSAFKRWQDWAAGQGVQALPADSFHVALYLVKLMQSSNTAAPVTAAVAGISWMHNVSNEDDPCSGAVVRNVHQAARRILAQPKARKTPMSRDLLKKLFSDLGCSKTLQDLQTITLIVVGFAGFFRWNDLSNIYVDQVVFHRQYAAVFLESRKNDQFRHGHWVFISRWSNRPDGLCPVALMEKLVQKGDLTGHVHLFGKIAKRRGKKVVRGKMSYSRARELVREAVAKIGEDPAMYGLHSLRSGGASVAASIGLPDRLIQRQGGWRSEAAMKAYFQEALPDLLKVSSAIAV